MDRFCNKKQLARNPLQAMARRWWCRSLFRATSGKRQCPE
jgi:hypothetical protein